MTSAIYRILAIFMKRVSSFHFIMFHRTNWIHYELEKKARKNK